MFSLLKKDNYKNLNFKFRADLNGVRAIAVLLVVFYHLDFSYLKGGFLGVDVFFVLSGYFISRIIISDLNLGNFSFKYFYLKRIKRLFPALIFTLIITLISGYFVLSPYDYKNLGESSLWSSLSGANIYFWLESGYFDSSSIYKPLLHFWSLSLEEQFYLLWPVFLYLIHKFKIRYLYIFIICFLLSLGVAHIFGRQYISGNFFLLPSRVFEFVLGAMCVLFESRAKWKRFFNYSGLIGYVLIIYACAAYNSDTFMPSAKSLIPCIGTVLIILQNRETIYSNILNIKPLQLIGKTSYSIYLIHWPLIVYYKYAYSPELKLLDRLLLISLSIAIGYLMWKYIENPFRKINNKKRGYILYVIPICIVSICFMSFAVKVNEGFINRFPVMKNLLKPNQVEIEKNRYLKNTFAEIEKINNFSSNTSVIIMGNSHAKDLIYALIKNGFKANISFLPTSSKCYNFGSPRKKEFVKECELLKQANLKNKAWSDADYVFLHDNWSVLDLDDLNQFLKTIRKLTKAPIYIFGPKLTFNRPALKIIHSSKYNDLDSINSYSRRFANLEDRRFVTEKIKTSINTEELKKDLVFFIDVLKIQFGDDFNDINVISSKDTKLLYFDSEHFTIDGALEFGQKLKKSNPELFELK